MSSFNLLPLLRSREYGGHGSYERHLFRSSIVDEDLYYDTNSASPELLQRQLQGHTSLPRKLQLRYKLEGHRGCVNSVQWSSDGQYLLSGSDDCTLQVYDAKDVSRPYRRKHVIRTGHTKNIFCAAFVPGVNTRTVSLGADGNIFVSDIDALTSVSHESTRLASFHHFLFRLEFLPNTSTTFLTTHEDGSVRLFDLRQQSRDEVEKLIQLSDTIGATSLRFDPLFPHHFALGSQDPYVRLYDIRMTRGGEGGSSPQRCMQRFAPRHLVKESSPTTGRRRLSSLSGVTGLDFSRSGEVVATYGGADVYLFNVREEYSGSSGSSQYSPEDDCTFPEVVQIYPGRNNTETFLKEVAFLNNDNYIATGGDCGHLFIWEKKSGVLVQYSMADRCIVNGIAPHPFLTSLATCGIDSDIKLFEVGDEEESGAVVAARRRISVAQQCVSSDSDDFGEYESETTKEECTATDGAQENEEDQEDSTSLGFRNLLNLVAPHRMSMFSLYSRNLGSMDVFTVDEAIESIDKARVLRMEGNDHFRAQEFERSEDFYSSAVDLLLFHAPSGSLESERHELLNIVRLNLANACLKLNRTRQARILTTRVLESDPTNIKGLYRRAQANMAENQWAQAHEDAVKALELAPGDGALRLLVKKTETGLAKAEQAIKKSYRALFEDSDDDNAALATQKKTGDDKPNSAEESENMAVDVETQDEIESNRSTTEQVAMSVDEEAESQGESVSNMTTDDCEEDCDETRQSQEASEVLEEY